MALTKDEKKKLDEVHMVVFGTDGFDGLAGIIKEIANSHYSLKRRVYMFWAFLVGTGLVGSGVWGVVRMFNGH